MEKGERAYCCCVVEDLMEVMEKLSKLRKKMNIVVGHRNLHTAEGGEGWLLLVVVATSCGLVKGVVTDVEGMVINAEEGVKVGDWR